MGRFRKGEFQQSFSESRGDQRKSHGRLGSANFGSTTSITCSSTRGSLQEVAPPRETATNEPASPLPLYTFNVLDFRGSFQIGKLSALKFSYQRNLTEVKT